MVGFTTQSSKKRTEYTYILSVGGKEGKEIFFIICIVASGWARNAWILIRFPSELGKRIVLNLFFEINNIATCQYISASANNGSR